MIHNPSGLDVAAIIDPNIRRPVSVDDLVTFTNATTEGVKFNDNVRSVFGTGNDAFIEYDGTNLLIHPKSVGSGYVNIAQDTATAGGAWIGRVGLGDSAPGNALCTFTTNGASVVTGFTGTLTYSGATSIMRAMVFTCVHDGLATSPTSAGGSLTGRMNINPTGTATAIGVQGTADVNVAVNQGTTNARSLIAKTVTGSTVGASGTLSALNLYVEAAPSFTGAGSIFQLSALIDGDTQITTGNKMIYEGSTTAKGDTYHIYDSGATELQTWVNGVKVFGATSTTLTNYVTTNGFGISLGLAIASGLGYLRN